LSETKEAFDCECVNVRMYIESAVCMCIIVCERACAEAWMHLCMFPWRKVYFNIYSSEHAPCVGVRYWSEHVWMFACMYTCIACTHHLHNECMYVHVYSMHPPPTQWMHMSNEQIPAASIDNYRIRATNTNKRIHSTSDKQENTIEMIVAMKGHIIMCTFIQLANRCFLLTDVSC